MNRENLKTLADYLDGVPAEDFDMMQYAYIRPTIGGAQSSTYISPVTAGKHPCGTVACAAGYGPAAGIKPRVSEGWDAYVERVFDLDGEEYDYCFSPNWAITDNTPLGAARRIRTMLESGVPADFRGIYAVGYAGDLPA